MDRCRVAPGIVALLACALPLEVAAADDADRSDAACLECHGDPDQVDRRLVVDPAELGRGPHQGEAGCVDCHTKAQQVDDVTDHGELGPARCAGCHEAAAEIAKGAHGRGKRHHAGRNLPGCGTCHGKGHGLRKNADPTSPVYLTRQPATCGGCHQGAVVDEFALSVHGQALAACDCEKAPPAPVDGKPPRPPSCSSCHGGHRVELGDVQRNPAFKRAMVRTCGGCHERAAAAYRPSIHGKALLEEGRIESASCADCHRGHEIYRPSDPRSAVFATRVTEDCAKCHADAKLIRRFELRSKVVDSYERSYHGLASHEGDTQVANCASCHEFHAIFPKDDPRSSIHPQNLHKTCGGCHPGASKNFLKTFIHVPIGGRERFASWLVKQIYIWLIALVIGGMVVHNLIDFARKMRRRARRIAWGPHVVRMTGIERLSHLALMLSFVTLAYSGFALLYPDAFWAAPLRWISNTERFRSLLHRTAGIALMLVSLHHLWFITRHPRGRQQFRLLLPRLRDFRDLRQNILFMLGRREPRPRFHRFSYIEKAEYWALVWGTVLMTITGLVLWFEQRALRVIPKWLFDVCEAVHLYEAILAVLAIVVWHFYFVLINPDEAPMSTAWVTGRVPLEEVKKVRPEEYEMLVREGEFPPDLEDDADNR